MKKLIEEDLNHIDEIYQYGQDDELSVEELQDLRDKLANWYQVRYPDCIIEKRMKENPDFLKIGSLEQLLKMSSHSLSVNNLRKLKFFLSSQQIYLLECDYGTYAESLGVSIYYITGGYYNPINNILVSLLIQNKNTAGEDSLFYIVDDQKENHMINSYVEYRENQLEVIMYGLIKKHGDKIDSKDLERLINKYNDRIELRNQLIQSVAVKVFILASTPEIGYYRAKLFLSEMVQSLGLVLTTDDIDDIYFADNPEEMANFISQTQNKIYQKRVSN